MHWLVVLLIALFFMIGTALDFLPMVKKEMAEGRVPPPTAPFYVGNDQSFGRWRGKSLASVPPE
jgi:hypothetical protein